MSGLEALKVSARGALIWTTLLFGAAASVGAAPITKQLNVTVVVVCNDDGAECASTGPAGNAFFEAETDKIWAQAGIDVNFVLGTPIWDTGLNFNRDTPDDRARMGDYTAPLTGPGTTMYLVNLFFDENLFGLAWSKRAGSTGGLVINMGAVMAFNSGIGRLDTIAHELGHNLGLDWDTNGSSHSSDPLYLMTDSTNRLVPSSLADIYPDGAGYSQLPQAQIDVARRSTLLIDYLDRPVPEPGSLALVALGLLGAAGTARRVRA